MKRSLAQRLRFRQLRMVEALVRFQTLSSAAAHLGLTQPALTKAIKELEALTGETLFQRHPRGVRPTNAGLQLDAFARRALADLSRLEAALDPLGDEAAPSVTIGALPVAAVGLLPAVVQRARAAAPGLKLRVLEGRTEDLLARLETGEVDVMVGRLYPLTARAGLRQEVLYTEPINVLARAGHPLLRLPRVSVLDVSDYDMVLPEISQRLAQDVAAYMEAVGLSPPAGALRSTSRGFIREMLLETDLVTVMPRLAMGGDLVRGRVRLLPISTPVTRRPAGVVTRSDRGRAVIELISLIRAAVAELSATGAVDITDGNGFE